MAEIQLQQRLPLAVLKHCRQIVAVGNKIIVATALTACGIETEIQK